MEPYQTRGVCQGKKKRWWGYVEKTALTLEQKVLMVSGRGDKRVCEGNVEGVWKII